jgi:hypothetical protein
MSSGTAAAVIEFFLSGEPQFTPDDAFNVWSWILTNAQTCLVGEDRPQSIPVTPVSVVE